MIKKLFYLLVLGVAVYSGIKLAIPHYHYQLFKSDVEELAQLSIADVRPDEMRERIIKLADQYKIPLKMRDLIIKAEGGYSILVTWEETVNIFDVYKRTFVFYIDASADGKRDR
ncbi:MAG: hypothetical protein HZA10_02070 [Nitrospirae bacterium]|nr:hypothetical protein [Nitrospirota bacterium]